MNIRRKKLFDILIMTPREGHNKTGIGKVSDILTEKICSIKKINAIQTSFDTKIDFLIFRKLFLAFNYIFIGFFNRKIKLSKIIFCTTSRLPYFLPKEIFKVIFVHDLVYLREPETMSMLGLYASKLLAPNSIKRADLIFCPSKSTYNDIKRFYPEQLSKVEIIPLATSLTKVKKIKFDNLMPKNYILCIGTIEPRKNYLNILQAYDDLPLEFKNSFKLIIVGGEGWGRVNLRNKIQKLNLQNNIFIKNYVSDVYLRMLLENAYVLLYPSLYEGFGLPILEAQSFGVPVITSNISSMPEIAGDGALYVDPKLVRSITSALEKIISNKKLRNKLSKKSLENSKKFNWSITTKLLLSNLYKKEFIKK